MPAECINEPIQVIAHFDDKGVQPLRFKWNDKVYRISEVWQAYTEEEKQTKVFDFGGIMFFSGKVTYGTLCEYVS